MAAMTAALIGAAAGAAGSIYSANQQSKAAKKSAQAVQQAGDANVAEQRRQYDQTRQDWLPFQQSDLARRSMADRSYGIQSTPSTTGGTYQGNVGQPNYAAYVNSNPDLLDAYNQSGGQYGDINGFGMTHYNAWGQGEGRTLPIYEQQQTMGAQGQAANQPFDPLSDFNASADRALLNYQPIANNINAMFSAKGAGLDGSAIRGLQDNSTKYTQNAFYQWRNGLEGNNSGANNAISSAGQNQAAANSNTRNNTANAMASSYGQQANANSSAVGGVLGAGNWYAQQNGWFKK
jgi:hypothetical protein